MGRKWAGAVGAAQAVKRSGHGVFLVAIVADTRPQKLRTINSGNFIGFITSVCGDLG
ncbi:unnamed protein product [Ciceribacter sp. T2.26MG-112.2]|nr:unnamed protein product [Ciceribacter naphthalenivorans]